MNDGGAEAGRYLDRDVSRPPTHELRRAARGEPEMVSADVERGFAVEARRRDRQRRVDAYSAMRATVVPALEQFLAVVGTRGEIGSTARAARRSIERLGQQVAR